MKRIKIKVTGNVQGVFFRKFIKDKASTLGLKGWSQNKMDGSVEAVVEGDDNALNILLSYCRQGPTGATIKEIKFQYEPYTGEFSDFSIKS